MPLKISSFQLLANTGKQNSIELIIPTVQAFWLCNFALTKIWDECCNYLYAKLKRTADSAKTIPIKKCLFVEKSMLVALIFR
jgi:hypothetical protein